jgi:YHS domain-containing protein
MKSVLRAAAAAAVAVAALVLLAAALARAQQAAPGQEKKSETPKVIVPFFGNETCPFTGKPIAKNRYLESDGQRVWFCCNNCLGKAKADPKAALAAAYPAPKPAGNKTCPVSGHAIEEGKGAEVVFESRKVALCCSDCEPAFKKSPLLYTAMAVYGATDLKNKKCPVMKVNEGNDEDVVEDEIAVYDGKVVHFCCSDCVPEFVKDPGKFMAAVRG